jgi:chemotaxis protein histidine kinase CheA
MKSTHILLILVLIIFGVSTVSAEIYTWTDEKGVRHYGDSPPEDAEDVKVVGPEYQYDESADKKRTQQDQEQLKSLLKEIEAGDAAAQAEARKQAEQAEKNRKPNQQELIAVEKERLEKRIAYLEEQPLEYFGSQKNKTVRIGYYRYRLQELMENPDKYFKQPASFEGNVKNPVPEAPAQASGGAGN